ncbi:type IV secretion system DNA-binding domain-containing protein [Candidatus Falkowbacteria bacterium]|nr:type IV secretion system DNA-binding domain-containing protein [Candidatus Falkowbacteria bacterium]
MPDRITPMAFTNFRSERKKFGIKEDDRRRHMYLIGKTGMGKSVLIENMAYSDIANGNGACIVDPHGDSAELLVDCIPSSRINDVIYMNPSDLEYPIAFNVLEKVDSKYRHLVASGLVGVFKKIWADSWGPRLEYILRNTILALLDYPDSTLLGVNRMLVDKEYRKKVLAKVQDPVVKMFWQEEFAKYNQNFLTEAIAPIQNKIGQFLSTALIRNIVGQVKSTINLRQIMDEGKILILNLSKGRIGEDASALLGAMIITKIQLAAMSRVDIPEKERRDFYLYVDEFQNFATESFANILSEARKYHLCLTIGHQYIGQLEVGGNTVVRDAIFGNVGTLVCFRVGAADAEFLAREFTPKFTEEDLVNLPKYNVYMKLMINGVSSDPFSATTLPPISKRTNSTETIIKVTRERYAKERNIVEDKIVRWSGIETEAMLEKLEKELEEKKAQKTMEKRVDFLASMRGENSQEEEDEESQDLQKRLDEKRQALENSDSEESEEAAPRRWPVREREKKKDEIVNVVNCSWCGVKTKINFNPDPRRPVLCKDCLKDYRRKQALDENIVQRKTASGAGAPGERKDDARGISLSNLKTSHPSSFRDNHR